MKHNPYVIAFFKLHKFVFNWVCNNVATEDENIFPKSVSKVVGHGNEPNKCGQWPLVTNGFQKSQFSTKTFFIYQKIIIEHEIGHVVLIINLDMDYYTIAIKYIFLEPIDGMKKNYTN